MRRAIRAAPAANCGAGHERAQGRPDPPRECVRFESDSDVELLDAACVERLVATERQQQLRHAMGKGMHHGSQSPVPDHRCHAGHEAIVIAEGHDLDPIGEP
jgi:hypothetical protein